jgi:integrase
MANKKTLALSKDQYTTIIETLNSGIIRSDGTTIKPNNRIATILVIEANTGLRIGDVLSLRFTDIIKDGDRYRLDIVEQKTSKKRTFTIPYDVRNYLELYILRNNIEKTAVIFPISERAVQKQLKMICDHLNYERLSTHSFRKFFATQIYINENYNIELVRQLLQHSSTSTTQKYIGIGSKELENAITSNLNLI